MEFKYFCFFCKEKIIPGEAIALIQEPKGLIHQKCVRIYNLQLKGFIYKCPVCDGIGYSFKETPVKRQSTDEEDIIEAGWAGSMYPYHFSHEVTEIKSVKTDCDFCNGIGYLKEKPVKRQIITEVWGKE